jgi:transcriptional accessory protein Tex/SPT6
VAVVDATGKVLATSVVYPTFSEKKKQDAIAVLSAKAEKAKKRRAEAKAHIRNVRTGKKK